MGQGAVALIKSQIPEVVQDPGRIRHRTKFLANRQARFIAPFCQRILAQDMVERSQAIKRLSDSAAVSQPLIDRQALVQQTTRGQIRTLLTPDQPKAVE